MLRGGIPQVSRPEAQGGVRGTGLCLALSFVERGFIRHILYGQEFQFHATGVANGAGPEGALIEHVSLKLVSAVRTNPDVLAHADLLQRFSLAREVCRSPISPI